MPKTVEEGEGLSARRKLPKSSIYRASVVIPEGPPPDTFVPSTKFNDSRNGQYVALLFEDF